MDILTPEQRSERMRRVRQRHTKPELIVRKLLHANGFRYRLNDPRLPGRPDIVFPGRRKVVFVHGCFWHQHVGCRAGKVPATRQDFWLPKFDANRGRDRRNVEALEELGWSALVVWECETRDLPTLLAKLIDFLG